MPTVDPVARRERAVRRLWRLAFALYAGALTIGTHWPRLELGVGDVPAPDKIIHFIAFGGLAFLLWMTGLITRTWLVLLVAAIWVFLDEVTQAIPILGRRFSGWDVTAGLLGTACFATWVWATAPLGGALNHMRLAGIRFALQEFYTWPRTWLHSAGSGGAMALMIGVCTGLLIYWYQPLEPAEAIRGALVGALAGGIAGVLAMVDARMRTHRDSIFARRPCFRCGGSCESAAANEGGVGRCPTCKEKFHLGQWLMRSELPRFAAVRLGLRAGWLAIVLGLGAAALYIILLAMHFHLPDVIAAFVRARGMPDDMRLTIDIAVLAVILGVAVRRYRKGVAVAVDSQAKRCRVCGHDVHATPTDRGIGRCGECGTVFVRLHEANNSPWRATEDHGERRNEN